MPRPLVMLRRMTAHVPDYANSVPPEFDDSGKMIQGRLASRPVPPFTPFEVESAEEAERLVKVADAIRIPADEADPVGWIRGNAADLGISPSAHIGEPVRLGH